LKKKLRPAAELLGLNIDDLGPLQRPRVKSLIKMVATERGEPAEHTGTAYGWAEQVYDLRDGRIIHYSPYPSSSYVAPKHSADEPSEWVALALFGNNIKLVALQRDGTYKFLDESCHAHNIIYVVDHVTLALQKAVHELESLAKDPNARESDFQEFFEAHPDFILNDEYKRAHPHIVLMRDDEKALIPDFVLEPIDQNALCDLLELKPPSAKVFVLKRNRWRFSAAVWEACAQIREYSLFFDEEKNQKRIKREYGLSAYKPKMFVIIGRRGTVSPIDFQKIEQDLPKDVYLRTYDDIVKRIKSRIERTLG